MTGETGPNADPAAAEDKAAIIVDIIETWRKYTVGFLQIAFEVEDPQQRRQIIGEWFLEAHHDGMKYEETEVLYDIARGHSPEVEAALDPVVTQEVDGKPKRVWPDFMVVGEDGNIRLVAAPYPSDQESQTV